MTTSKHSSDPKVILTWVRKAKGVYVPLPGSGGGNVRVAKSDFKTVMQQCAEQGGELETEYTLHHNGNIYA